MSLGFRVYEFRGLGFRALGFRMLAVDWVDRVWAPLHSYLEGQVDLSK